MCRNIKTSTFSFFFFLFQNVAFRISRITRESHTLRFLTELIYYHPSSKPLHFARIMEKRDKRDAFWETRGSRKARVTFRNSRESRLSMRSENTASRRVVVVFVAADCDSTRATWRRGILDPVSNYLRKSLKSHQDAGMVTASGMREEIWELINAFRRRDCTKISCGLI